MTTVSNKVHAEAGHGPQSLRFRIRKQSAIISRWLHLYLSMVSFAVVLFFAVTGLTLNHAEWFQGTPRTTRYEGVVAKALLGEGAGAQPDRLGIVEFLRNSHGIKGAVADFRVGDDQVEVSFKGPGYQADSFIQRGSGKYELVEVRSGFIAVMNDLHKGRDTGTKWAWVIDVSAVLLTLVSLSGLVLIWFVYKKRVSGLIIATVGAMVCWLLYRAYVP